MIVTKNVESIITSSRAVIAKEQALIQDNEQKLTNKKKKMEEFEAAKSQVQQEINVRTSKLEALLAQLITRKLSSNEELRFRALAEVEEARQRDIQCLKDQIKSLAERD